MNIVLINLPSPALSEPWTNFPLGIGYIAASAEQAGHNVQILDFCDKKELQEIDFQNLTVDVFGLSVTTPQVEFAKTANTIIRRLYPSSKIIAGGPHMLVMGKEFLEEINVDSIVIGEGDHVFPVLLKQLEQGYPIETVYNAEPIKDLDILPFTARHLLPGFKQKALKTKQLLKGDYTNGGQTTIIASRGCYNNCSFCAPHSRIVRFRSPQNVVDEIKTCFYQFGISQFKWQDDTFTSKKTWILELCRLLKELPFKTYHRVHTRVNVFDEEMAIALKDAGVKLLCFGIESFSQEILDRNNKRITIDQIENSFRLAKKYDFRTVGFLIYGLPGETPETVEITKQKILENRKYLDYLNLATMVPLPGTPIWEEPESFGCEILDHNYKDYWIVDHDYNDKILVKTIGVSIAEAVRMKNNMYAFLKELGYSRPEWRL